MQLQGAPAYCLSRMPWRLHVVSLTNNYQHYIARQQHEVLFQLVIMYCQTSLRKGGIHLRSSSRWLQMTISIATLLRDAHATIAALACQ